MLEASYGERFEDHPGAALIQPGRHRYRPMSGAYNEGGTAVALYIVPEQSSDCSGVFYSENRPGGKENEDYVKGWIRKGICRKQIGV